VGDALQQGPAQERTLPAQPKPAKPDSDTATSEDVPSSVIELAAVTTKLKAAEVAAVPREVDGLVTVRPKPERRKNAKARAKEKYTKDGATPDTTAKAKSKVASKPKTEAK
jgi:hypothetical protein